MKENFLVVSLSSGIGTELSGFLTWDLYCVKWNTLTPMTS